MNVTGDNDFGSFCSNENVEIEANPAVTFCREASAPTCGCPLPTAFAVNMPYDVAACVNVPVRFPMLESVVSQPNTLLMWPGPEAEDLKSFLASQHRHGTTDVKYTLIILDGTWHQARSLYNQNSFLHSLKQVGHLKKIFSGYKFR